MNQPPYISAIIVNWNGGALILQAIGALIRSAEGLNLEIIVIDNASTDGSPDRIADAFSQVCLMRMQSNLGFCRANNQALKIAKGKAVLLLNPDAIPEGQAIKELYEYLMNHPDVGVVGPRLLFPDGSLDAACRRHSKTISTYIYKVLMLDTLFKKSPRFGRYNITYLDQEILTEVDSVSGACLLVKREALNDIGTYMDERFFMYCEDEDWCCRIKQAGWKIVYYPRAIVWHYKGNTSSRHPRWRVRLHVTYHWHRSVWIFHEKHLAPKYNWVINAFVYCSIIAVGAIASVTTIIQGYCHMMWQNTMKVTVNPTNHSR